MRLLIATGLVAAVGCGFEHGQLDTTDDPGVDAAVGPGPGSGTMPTPPTAPRTCAYTVTPDLRLCLEFDDGVLTPTVRDASTGQHDAIASGLTATMRSSTPADPAVTVASGATMTIGETSALDITSAITIEAWVRPAQKTNQAVVLNDGQYMLGLDDNGRVYCSMAAAAVWSAQTQTTVAIGTWHHIACTYDGSRVRTFLDGSSSDCREDNAPGINPNGNKGTTIAPSFVGDIDGVRIWSRDLGATSELCTHANRTSCQKQCNSYEYPDGGGYWHF